MPNRLDVLEAKEIFTSVERADLALKATLAKQRFHAPNQATYLKMAIVNYTNICVAKCDYCAFYRLPHQSGTYLLSAEQVIDRVEEMSDLGCTMVGLNGGFHPKLRIDDYANLFSKLRQHFGDRMQFYGMTVAEFMFAAKVSKLSYDDAAKRLADTGSEWVTGGGAEILDDAFRMRHSPGKYKVEDYYAAQRAILNAGMGSTATMVIGFDESLDERMRHLERLRRFQDEMDGLLTSFLCWTYKPFHTELGGTEISNEEYLRWLATCRLFLDNFRHIRTSVLTKNEHALDGLLFGADDFDLPLEDEVTQKAGATINKDFEQVLNYGKELGLNLIHRKPFERSKRQTESFNESFLDDISLAIEDSPTRQR